MVVASFWMTHDMCDIVHGSELEVRINPSRYFVGKHFTRWLHFAETKRRCLLLGRRARAEGHFGRLINLFRGEQHCCLQLDHATSIHVQRGYCSGHIVRRIGNDIDVSITKSNDASRLGSRADLRKEYRPLEPAMHFDVERATMNV
jgi:hypothetical protein